MHPSPSRPRPLAPALAGACLLAAGASAGIGPVGAAGGAETRAGMRAVLPGPGARVVQGDILVDAAPATRGIGYARGRTWPDGRMPVWFDPALPAGTAASIESAIALWNDVAGITIERIDTVARPGVDHVHFQPGDGCASWVGRRGGPQELWVAADCTTGSIVHELGHALGLEHEHVRPDRDQWIEIRWDHVIEEKRHNFDIAGGDLETLGDYDYASIMHYGPDFFSKDGEATIRPLVGGRRIGQREAPSAGDIDAIARVYGTDLSLAGSLATPATPAAIPDGGELQLAVTNDGGRGAHGIGLTLPPGLVVTAATSVDAWACETADGTRAGDARVAARCTLDRLGAGARSTLALAVRPAAAADGAATGLGRIDVELDAVNDDPVPANDRISLGEATPGGRAEASAPAAATGIEPGDGSAGVQADDAGTVKPVPHTLPFHPDTYMRSPFEVIGPAHGAGGTGVAGPAASRPHPGKPVAASPVTLTTIVATPGPDAASAGDGDEGRLERLLGGAAGPCLPLLAVAFGVRRRTRRRPGEPGRARTR